MNGANVIDEDMRRQIEESKANILARAAKPETTTGRGDYRVARGLRELADMFEAGGICRASVSVDLLSDPPIMDVEVHPVTPVETVPLKYTL